MGEEDKMKNKSEQKQLSVDDERIKRLETCEFLVGSVLAFGVYNINKLKVKDIRVLLLYHFGSEKLKGSQKSEACGGC